MHVCHPACTSITHTLVTMCVKSPHPRLLPHTVVCLLVQMEMWFQGDYAKPEWNMHRGSDRNKISHFSVLKVIRLNCRASAMLNHITSGLDPVVKLVDVDKHHTCNYIHLPLSLLYIWFTSADGKFILRRYFKVCIWIRGEVLLGRDWNNFIAVQFELVITHPALHWKAQTCRQDP